jgi:uncharacterized protein YegL
MPMPSVFQHPRSPALGRAARAIPALLLAWLALWPRLAAAAGTEAAGLDLVFVLDQSGSMSKKDGSKANNDPLGLRVEFLGKLRKNLVAEAARGYTTRISVVEFGSRDGKPGKRPETTLKGKVVPPVGTGRDSGQVEQDLSNAFDGIKALSRGDTDHPEALKLAQRELEDFARAPLAVPMGGKAGDRQPVVMLITDGKPYTNTLSESELLRQARDAVRQFAGRVPEVKFGVVGLGDTESRYWYSACDQQGCGQFWKDLTTKAPDGQGIAYLANPYSRFEPLLNDVYRKLTGREGACGQDNAAVPPYLRALNLTVSFSQYGLPLSALDIHDPQGNKIMPGPGDKADKLGVAFRVPYPQPGQWQLRKASADYEVCLDYEREEAQLIKPANPPAQNLPTEIRYRLAGRGPNDEFQEQPGFPVNFTVTIKDPLGKETVLSLAPDPARPGEIVSVGSKPDPAQPGKTVRTTAQYAFPQPGEYRLKLLGEAASLGSPNGFATVYASRDADGEAVKVAPGTPALLRFESPPAAETLATWFGKGTIPARLVFVNAQDGKALAPGAVLGSAPPLEVKWAQENPPESAPSAPDFAPMAEDGDALRAELPVDLGDFWRYLVWPGELRLHLKPIRFAQGMVHAGVEDGGDWNSRPYPIREHRGVLTGLLALILIALAALSGWLWRVYNDWRIRAQDRKEGFKPRLELQFPDFSQYAAHWKLAPRVVTQPGTHKPALPDQTDWAIQDFKIRRRYKEGGVCAKVWFRPRRAPGDSGPAEIETVVLETTSDELDRSGRRARVKGLGDFGAVFVLMTGKQQNGGWGA